MLISILAMFFMNETKTSFAMIVDEGTKQNKTCVKPVNESLLRRGC